MQLVAWLSRCCLQCSSGACGLSHTSLGRPSRQCLCLSLLLAIMPVIYRSDIVFQLHPITPTHLARPPTPHPGESISNRFSVVFESILIPGEKRHININLLLWLTSRWPWDKRLVVPGLTGPKSLCVCLETQEI